MTSQLCLTYLVSVQVVSCSPWHWRCAVWGLLKLSRGQASSWGPAQECPCLNLILFLFNSRSHTLCPGGCTSNSSMLLSLEWEALSPDSQGCSFPKLGLDPVHLGSSPFFPVLPLWRPSGIREEMVLMSTGYYLDVDVPVICNVLSDDRQMVQQLLTSSNTPCKVYLPLSFLVFIGGISSYNLVSSFTGFPSSELRQ